MRNKVAIALGSLGASVSVFADDSASSSSGVDVTTIMNETIANANTILAAVLTIGGVVLAWKLLRKFFSKTG